MLNHVPTPIEKRCRNLELENKELQYKVRKLNEEVQRLIGRRSIMCQWDYHEPTEDTDGYYTTSCGEGFDDREDFSYCPACGGAITEDDYWRDYNLEMKILERTGREK